jgi:ubiquinone/menaquinone biosynthesis C-methylase UbiE
MTESKHDGELSKYVIGHTKGVTNILSGRSAARSMAFLLPHLRPDMHILDVGCGPGSITCDIAELTPAGQITGVDLSPAAIDQARAACAGRKIENATFAAGNILSGLSFEDQSFDVVLCHQLLNHLSDPVKALREMKRLCKPDGIVAVREGICHLWHPDEPILQDQDKILDITMRHSGAYAPGAGRYIYAWAKESGFEPTLITFTVSGVPNKGPEWRAKQQEFFKDCFSEGAGIRMKAIKAGVQEKQISDFLETALAWIENEEAYQVMICGEIICKMGGGNDG